MRVALMSTLALYVLLLPLVFGDGSAPLLLSSSRGLPGSTQGSPFRAPLVCQNGGVLVQAPRPGDAARVDVQCACLNGFSGARCEFRDFCASPGPNGGDLCQNGGTCFNTRGGALCHCTNEWAGATCSVPSPCAGNPCSGHGDCLLREETEQETGRTPPKEPGAQAAVDFSQHDNSDSKDKRGKPEHQHGSGTVNGASEPGNESDITSKSLTNDTVGTAHYLGTVIVGRCRCEPGWTSADCSLSHSDVCAAVPPCTIFNSANATAPGGTPCGCQAALAKGCIWCLEQGAGFAPGVSSPAGDTCNSPVTNLAQCPPPPAQAIHTCAVIDGTPFGWCVSHGGPHGWSTLGNPITPQLGSHKCGHWVWTEAGCKEEWTTGTLAADGKDGPDEAQRAQQCEAVPLCADRQTASSTLCGCQAALSIGCHWCLESQRAFPRETQNATCRSVAHHPMQCPSQQAQTVRKCVDVGNTPYGWCSVDDDQPLIGYSMDGTSKSPARHPDQCKSWMFHSASCPADSSAASASFTVAVAMPALTLELSDSAAHDSAAVASSSAPAPAPNEEAALPPKYLSHQTRLWILLYLSIIVLALFFRWLPEHWKSDYHTIPERPTGTSSA